MRRQPVSAIRVSAVGGIVGPAAFITAWAVLGRSAQNYSPTQDAISRLAATGAPTRGAMTAGLVAFGTGVPVCAIALRSALPGKSWMLATVTGLAALGVAALPLGSPTRDAAHGAFATIGYATLAALPLTAAGPLARQGRHHWAVFSRVAGTVSGLCLAATLAGPAHGFFQRVGLTVADLWVMATAVDILQKDSQ